MRTFLPLLLALLLQASSAASPPTGNRQLPPDPDVPPAPPAPLTPAPPQGYKNVLFVVVDDLRAEIGAYGHHYMKTPHLDKLASEGTVYTRAYGKDLDTRPLVVPTRPP